MTALQKSSLPIFCTFETLEHGEKPRTSVGIGSSLLIHAALVAAIVSCYYLQVVSLPAFPDREMSVMINLSRPFPLGLPSMGHGGGGGGGGKREKNPASKGVIPPAQSVQTVTPEVRKPDLRNLLLKMEVAPNIQAPIPFPARMLGAYGDFFSSIVRPSDGPGSGEGIGPGKGTGIGPGEGPGVGPGSNGGFGRGPDGGVGSDAGPHVAGKNGVSNPILIRQTLPHYTDEAIKAKTQGVVVLQAIIRRDGTVDQARVIRSLGYGLDQEAVRCVVNEWKFRPGLLNGRPVDVYATIEITFTLR